MDVGDERDARYRQEEMPLLVLLVTPYYAFK